ncbi:hypothetical protein [Pseudomonas sp. W03]|uniref:hypothetical protein n=1 Tax=Pseudomonas sp. W03 TaxID=3090666 RepID=UPI003A4D4925
MINSNSPVVGSQYLLENTTYVVTCVLNDQISLCSLTGYQRRYLSRAEFAVLQHQGSIIKMAAAPGELSDASRLLRSAADRKKYDYRRAYVDAYLEQKELSGCSRNRLCKLIDATAASLGDQHKPSFATVYHWTMRYLRNNRNPLALLPNYPQNRPRPTKPAVIELMKHYINAVYLTRERPTIQYTYRLLKGHIQAENIKRMKAEVPLLKAPSYATFWRQVLNTDRYLTARMREGNRAAHKTFKHGRALHVDDDLYATVQFDAKTMDVEIVDQTGKLLGRPVLVAGINPATRECVAWHMAIGAPCAEFVVSALVRAIRGEEDDPNSGGKMRNCDLDNGSENVNDWLQNIAGTLGISLRYVPPGQPDAKAFVERFFRTVDLGLVHMLPGTTKGSPAKLGDYKSRQHACLTLEQLRAAFAKWLKIYHNSYHEELFMSPHQKRMELLAKSPPPERYSQSDLEQLTRSICYRRLTNGRVKLFWLSWTGPGVAEIAARLGKKQTAIVYYDPCDLSVVWVAHRQTPKEIIPAYATRPTYQHELTLSVHLNVMREINDGRRNFKDSEALKLRLELFEDIQEIKRQATKRSAKQRSNRARASGKSQMSSRPYIHSEEAIKQPVSVSLSIIESAKFDTFNVEDICHEEP